MRILVDIDGTLRNVWPTVNRHVLEATGVKLPDVWHTYDTARNIVGDEVAEAAFELACGSYGDDDVWYPGAWDAMRELSDAGVEPVFCTFNPWRQARTIARELEPLYGRTPRVERVLSSGNKLKVARRIDACGIIDDKPGTLRQFGAAGYFTATIEHPYNADVKVDCRFSDWREVYLLDELRHRVWWQMRIDESEAV